MALYWALAWQVHHHELDQHHHHELGQQYAEIYPISKNPQTDKAHHEKLTNEVFTMSIRNGMPTSKKLRRIHSKDVTQIAMPKNHDRLPGRFMMELVMYRGSLYQSLNCNQNLHGHQMTQLECTDGMF